MLVFDQPALTAVEVRGAAPGTRELDLLGSGRLVQRVDAILLAGGSAFGLAAADGVVRWLADQDRGFSTSTGPVPIVPAAVIFDRAVGAPAAPSADEGRHAASHAGAVSRVGVGAVGVGTGATFGKIRGATPPRQGGLGIAQVSTTTGLMTAVVVLNAWGDAFPALEDDPRRALLADRPLDPPYGEATTLIALVHDGAADHGTLQRCCVAAHDALARKIAPAHTMVDGDVAFASALYERPVDPEEAMRLTLTSELAVEAALESIIARA